LLIFWGAVLGLSDFLMGIVISPTLYQYNDLNDGLSAIFFGQIFYIGFSLIVGALVGGFIFGTRRNFYCSDRIFSFFSGLFSGIFFFLVYPLFVSFTRQYLKFEGLFVAGISALFAGVGVYYLVQRFFEKGQDRIVFPFYLWIILWVLANLSLVFFSQFSLTLKTGIFLVGCLGILGIILFGFYWIGSRKKKFWIKLILAIFFAGAGGLPWIFLISSFPKLEKIEKSEQKVNLIMIVADTCRADALGIYGGKNFTPVLDSLAQEGIWFKNVISQGSYTTPSVASLFTSYYPPVFHYSHSFNPEFTGIRIFPEFYTMAERLQKYGYYTVGFFANFLLTKKDGFLQGFEKIKLLNHLVRIRQLGFLPIAYTWQKMLLSSLGFRIYPYSSKVLTDRAIKFLGKKRKEPFFLVLYFNDPHDPYNPPAKYLKEIKYKGKLRAPFSNFSPYLFKQRDILKRYHQVVSKDDLEGKRFVKELYLAEVRYIDEQISRLIQYLKRQGLDKNTIVVFTSDHGEEFWEHGANQHGNTLYQELLKVPLIIWGNEIKSAVVEQPIESVDLLPSLLEFLNIPLNPPVQGKSFWEVVYNPEQELHKYFFSQGGIGTAFYSVQDERFKLIYYPSRKNNQYELYDLKKDLKEKENIFSPSHPAFKILKAQLDIWLENCEQVRKKIIGKKSLTAREREILQEKLRSLGYIK